MSTPDPRRGDEPGEPINPAPGRPEHASTTPAVDDRPDPDETDAGARAAGTQAYDEEPTPGDAAAADAAQQRRLPVSDAVEAEDDFVDRDV